MKFKYISGVILVALMFLSSATHAQQVDIGLFQKDENTLEVRLLPSEDFKGMVSNVAFTIRWEADSLKDLGAIEQHHPESAYLAMVKSGEPAFSHGYNYQVFAGFGMTAMEKFGAQWNSEEEITLMTIPVNGGIHDFEIINDDWTQEIKNNGSFYISWGGKNVTGKIYQPKAP